MRLRGKACMNFQYHIQYKVYDRYKNRLTPLRLNEREITMGNRVPCLDENVSVEDKIYIVRRVKTVFYENPYGGLEEHFVVILEKDYGDYLY